MQRIAFILSQFPETYETFILREFSGFDSQGLPFEIFSLRECRDSIVHPDAETLLGRVHYSPLLLSSEVLSALVARLLGSPLRCLAALGFLVRRCWRSPLILAKSLAVFPKATCYARLVEQRGITHLHAHWATIPATVAMIVSRLTGVPFSVTAHAWDIYVHNPTLEDKIRQAKFIVTCTGFNRDHLRGLANGASDKILLNYHGIEPERFPVTESPVEDESLILSIGRLVETKGFPYLFRALRALVDRGKRFRCVIVGEGPDRAVLEEQLRSLDLERHVQLAGALPHAEVRELFRRSTLFALPSIVARNGDRDGIPNVLIEAMAMQRPVVSTSISGIPELVVHDETGLLVAEKDAESLGAALERMLDEPELRARLARAGRDKVVRDFDMQRNVRELIGHFRNFGAMS